MPTRETNAAGLTHFRSVGRSGKYPPWVDRIRGRSGVYAIKHRGVLVYIGESHTDRLYETMTRHLQHWTLPSSHSYERSECTVAVRTMAERDEAPALQAHFICELQPRDNEYEVCDHVPF